MENYLHCSDCLDVLKDLSDESVDLIYLDPPFFTQSTLKLRTRDRAKEFSFVDKWESVNHYADFIHHRLMECHRILRSSGSIFFHCDRNASHIIRTLLDNVFGNEMFRAEIIWYYRRWSNSQKNLLSSHQNILFYSKTNDYKFHVSFESYSPSTNVDQILQRRRRDEFGKSVYEVDEEGGTVFSGSKKGVPLGDVWDIPFLNPKAKERVGYPTQKPILLLERIITLTTDTGDWVLDPFCGSGTTLVAAKLLQRNTIGIDISDAAVEITRMRLDEPIKTDSTLLKLGRDAYENVDQDFLLQHLSTLPIIPVQRNKGIDAFLKVDYRNGPVPIRIQRAGEPLGVALALLRRAATSKNASVMILVATQYEMDLQVSLSLPSNVIIIESAALSIEKILHSLSDEEAKRTISQR